MKTNNTDSVQNQGLFSFQCLKPVGQRSLWHQSSSLYLGVSLNMKFLHPTLHPQKQQRHWNSEPQHDDGKRRMFIFFWILRWQMCLKTNRHSRTNDLTVWMSAKTKMTRRKNHNKKKENMIMIMNLCQLAKHWSRVLTADLTVVSVLMQLRHRVWLCPQCCCCCCCCMDTLRLSLLGQPPTT